MWEMIGHLIGPECLKWCEGFFFFSVTVTNFISDDKEEHAAGTYRCSMQCMCRHTVPHRQAAIMIME